MKKILFIEDNFEIRDNVEEVLNLEGFHIITEPNGKDGLQRAKQEIPDIILCDIMMPELDGYEVLSELRRDPLTQHIPFIVVSSKVEKKEIQKAFDLGANDYITKPFETSELTNCIMSFLNNREGI